MTCTFKVQGKYNSEAKQLQLHATKCKYVFIYNISIYILYVHTYICECVIWNQSAHHCVHVPFAFYSN